MNSTNAHAHTCIHTRPSTLTHFTYSLHSLTHSLTHSFAHTLTHALTHSLPSFAHTLTHSRSHSLNYTLTHSTHTNPHSLTHSDWATNFTLWDAYAIPIQDRVCVTKFLLNTQQSNRVYQQQESKRMPLRIEIDLICGKALLDQIKERESSVWVYECMSVWVYEWLSETQSRMSRKYYIIMIDGVMGVSEWVRSE